MNYTHSAFVIASRHVDPVEYSECFDITNRYITFLVINEVSQEDDGRFNVFIESAENVGRESYYILTNCELVHVYTSG